MIGIDGRTGRVVWTVIAFAAVLGLVYAVRKILVLAAFALVFAYLVFPLVRLLERWPPLRRRRALAIGLVYLVLLGAIAGGAAAAGPRLAVETTQLTQRLPEMSRQLQSGELIGNMLARRGWGATPVLQAESFVRAHLGELTVHAQGAVAAILKWLTGAWVVVLVPIFAFFFLKDGQRFAAAVEDLFEDRPDRAMWRATMLDLHHLLGEYVRALILLSLITFVVWSALFSLGGVPYAILLAALGGALEFIPVVGPVAAGAIVMTVSLVSGYAHPWALLGFLIAWRLIQDYASSPLIMSGGVELHPALVIFGVLAGGEVAGPVGMFLAIPVLAGARVVWRRLHAQHHAARGTRHDARPDPDRSAPTVPAHTRR